MSTDKADADQEEWEEVVMMMELPNGANLNVAKKDLYLEVAGMWTDKPVVKLDNMLYAGTVSETMGSHLFVESNQGDNAQNTHKKKDDERQILTANTVMSLEPVYLQDKTGSSSDTPGFNTQSQEDLKKI